MNAVLLILILLALSLLTGKPLLVFPLAILALALTTLWQMVRPSVCASVWRTDRREAEERMRGERVGLYACGDCGEPYEQPERWTAGAWRPVGAPFGACPACHPELVP